MDLAQDPEERKKQEQEYRIMKSLNHDNIVKCLDVFIKDKKKLRIVMEFCEKGDLSRIIKKSREQGKLIMESVILNWFTQICLGVLNIHNNKIVHKDLKPANIMITAENQMKIGDFGISKCLKETREMCKTFSGTIPYVSPEFVNEEPHSFKTDVWALGVILYELCALKTPFEASSEYAIMTKIVAGKFDSIPQGYSKGINKIISKILIPDPLLRPTVAEILDFPLIKAEKNKIITYIDIERSTGRIIFLNNSAKEQFGVLTEQFDATSSSNYASTLSSVNQMSSHLSFGTNLNRQSNYRAEERSGQSNYRGN